MKEKFTDERNAEQIIKEARSFLSHIQETSLYKGNESIAIHAKVFQSLLIECEEQIEILGEDTVDKASINTLQAKREEIEDEMQLQSTMTRPVLHTRMADAAGQNCVAEMNLSGEDKPSYSVEELIKLGTAMPGRNIAMGGARAIGSSGRATVTSSNSSHQKSSTRSQDTFLYHSTTESPSKKSGEPYQELSVPKEIAAESRGAVNIASSTIGSGKKTEKVPQIANHSPISIGNNPSSYYHEGDNYYSLISHLTLSKDVLDYIYCFFNLSFQIPNGILRFPITERFVSVIKEYIEVRMDVNNCHSELERSDGSEFKKEWNYYHHCGDRYQYGMEQCEKAISYYKIAINKNSNSARTYHNAAYCYRKLKQYGEAVLNYKKAIDSDNNNDMKWLYWHDLGDLYQFSMQNCENAILCYKNATSLNPNHTKTYENMAYCYEKLGLKQNAYEVNTIRTEIENRNKSNSNEEKSTLFYQDHIIRSATYGALRGVTNVMEHVMQQQDIRPKVSRYTTNSIYFFCYWLLSFMIHYLNDDNLSRAAINAGYEVLYLFIVNVMCFGLSWSSQHVAQYAQSAGRIGAGAAPAFSFFGRHVSKLIYVLDVRENGLVNTTLNVASGTLAQQAIEYIGDSCFLKNKKN